MSETVLDLIAARVRAALAYNTNAHVAPVALLWPDEGGQWQPVVARLGERMPVISLGGYEPSARRGPAYWIRCVIARMIDVGLADGSPVVYLPGVGRSALRAVGTCPAGLAPIAELQYRSQWFSHPSSRDWSVRAFLSHSERGLGLRVADDTETGTALLLALDRLLDERIDRLASQVLDADYLNQLVNPDPPRILLGWLDDPVTYRHQLGDAQWAAFVHQAKLGYGFDPNLDGEITAARKLGGRQGGWANVWKRFADTPERYTGIAEQLRKARPDQLIVENEDAWPQDNEMAEEVLRNRLLDFGALTAEAARQEAARLDAEHAWRRGTVWADLGLAPLAFALEQLVALAELTARPLNSADLSSLISDYVERGWRADAAVLRSLTAARSARDRAAVSAAVTALYRSWVDAGAKSLQSAIGPMANNHRYEPGPPASTARGTVTVFVDGLRFDTAHWMLDRLVSIGLDVQITASQAALPTVTETAKPALVPLAEGTLKAGSDLCAANAVTGTKASIQVLRSLMVENGVQVLGPTQVGDMSGTAWTEAGELDHRGHDVGIRLVDYLEDEIDRIVGRVRELLDAGWRRVDVVTDHGWLLLPTAMEKVELPPSTAELKKGRCARIKDGAIVEVPTVPWFWDQDVRIALAPGITCFELGKEYEHGGVSPQECVVPRLTVSIGAAATGGPEITKVKWLGLQCRIEFRGVTHKVVADIRGLPAEPKSSIAEHAKDTPSVGKVSLVVPDEEHEGERAHVVLVGPEGQILAQREVLVGRNR